jgi:hypothetical protein
MKLFHFTSEYHLRAISRHGLTVGDVPTDLASSEGRCGVWLTSNSEPSGHGLQGAAADKSRFRLAVDVPENGVLVKWVDWAHKNVTPETMRALHSTASAFDTWFIYFGVIPRARITECFDMRVGRAIEDWDIRPASPFDAKPIPPWRRAAWHRKMLRDVAAAASLLSARCRES